MARRATTARLLVVCRAVILKVSTFAAMFLSFHILVLTKTVRVTMCESACEETSNPGTLVFSVDDLQLVGGGSLEPSRRRSAVLGPETPLDGPRSALICSLSVKFVDVIPNDYLG